MICRTPVCFIGRRALTAAGRDPADRMGIPVAGNGALRKLAEEVGSDQSCP
jgi:hypothetical protein